MGPCGHFAGPLRRLFRPLKKEASQGFGGLRGSSFRRLRRPFRERLWITESGVRGRGNDFPAEWFRPELDWEKNSPCPVRAMDRGDHLSVFRFSSEKCQMAEVATIEMQDRELFAAMAMQALITREARQRLDR